MLFFFLPLWLTELTGVENGIAFNLIDYSSMAADDKEMARIFHVAHGVTAKILMVLVIGHFGAALYHHFVQKDSVLKRMLPFGKV